MSPPPAITATPTARILPIEELLDGGVVMSGEPLPDGSGEGIGGALEALLSEGPPGIGTLGAGAAFGSMTPCPDGP